MNGNHVVDVDSPKELVVNNGQGVLELSSIGKFPVVRLPRGEKANISIRHLFKYRFGTINFALDGTSQLVSISADDTFSANHFEGT